MLIAVRYMVHWVTFGFVVQYGNCSVVVHNTSITMIYCDCLAGERAYRIYSRISRQFLAQF